MEKKIFRKRKKERGTKKKRLILVKLGNKGENWERKEKGHLRQMTLISILLVILHRFYT